MKSIYKLLFEADEIAADYVVEDETGQANSKLSSDSIDFQIDQFLIKYDERAVAAGKDAEDAGLNESFANMSLKYLLTEQEDDPFAEDEGGGDEGGEDPFADEGGGEGDAGGGGDEDAEAAAEDTGDAVTNAEIQATEPAKIPSPPMNVHVFVSELNRLLAFPENILSLKPVIINRAKNYLLEHYDADHVEMFEEIMNEGPYQIEKFPRPGEAEDEPLAVGAFAGGTGGLGGGG